jgi:hypothetical protein
MTPHTSFHAEKPTLATHPVNGGDALIGLDPLSWTPVF